MRRSVNQGPLRSCRGLVFGLLVFGLIAGAAADSRAVSLPVYSAIGDSITDGYRVSTPWPARLAGLVGQGVSNDGVGGETTYMGLSRLQGVINYRKPTHMLIMFGTNDVNGPNNLDASASNLKQMAAICRQNFVVPIIATIPPFVGPKAGSNSRVQYLNSLIRANAGSGKYFVAEVYNAFGSGSGLFQSDGFHPNDAGQQFIAQAFFPTTSRPPLPGSATLIAPAGEITSTRRPTFTWSSVSGATWYRLLLQRADGTGLVDEWTQETSWTLGFDLGCGSYTWWIQTANQSGNGRWSSGKDFQYDGPECCVPDPVNGLMEDYIGGGVIDYTWTADECAQQNQVLVQRNGSAWLDKWYDANPSGGRDRVSIGGHSFGKYTFYVRGWSPDGTGVWSGGRTFQYGLAVPQAPAGTVSGRSPRFWWDDRASSDATWYRIWISRDGETYLTRWVAQSDTTASGGSRYYDFPEDVVFKYGSYTWWIQTYKADGYGPWSVGGSFTLPRRTPAAATPVGPDDVTVDTRRPVFSWSSVDDASWYQLWLSRNGTKHLSTWVNAATTWTPDADLPQGAYAWWVQTWNVDGYGPWSGEANFTIPSLAPAISAPVAPAGTISNRRPAFSWAAADRATHYYVYVTREGSFYYKKWYSATGFTPGWDLTPGAYRWWVQTYGEYGYGPWSAAADFTVQP